MNTTNWQKDVANNIRNDIIRATTKAGSGHPTSCLSSVEILISLFFEVMQYDPNSYEYPNNDRFILSKGHAAPLLYATWKALGNISDEELMQLRTFDSPLEGHPTARFRLHEAATGSLGQGLAIGLGEALASHIHGLDYRTFVLMGDSELAEGSIWEAAQLAGHYQTKNLIAYIDANRLGQRGESLMGTDYEKCASQWRSFGWDAHIIDGHNIKKLTTLGKQIREEAKKPTVIIAKTTKGYGLGKNFEDLNGFHGKPLTTEQAKQFLEKHPYKEISDLPHPPRPRLLQRTFINKKTTQKSFAPDNKKEATRKSYGKSLQSLGVTVNKLVVLDAEVKNSTFSYLFEEEYPNRFIECFIAEQSMIGIATGLARRGCAPFCSTFAAFLTRAYDQIRMAAIGKAPLRICGSHAGVSIGQDGPSQMGLEDLAMMRSLPESIVFYPADSWSTYRCVELMQQYDKGVSYLRTTREATPIIYNKDTEFKIGGCHTIKKSNNDHICIVTAGITLFETLKAYKLLQNKNISIRVIDCYSIKPLPKEQILEAIKESNNRIITVEDHYQAGGLGEAIGAIIPMHTQHKILAVQDLPQSASPEKLRATMKIDTQAIIQCVQKMIDEPKK